MSSAILHFRIHSPDGRLIGAAEAAEDAAALVSLRGEGGTVRFRNKIVWREGADGQAGESYDAAGGTIIDRAKAYSRERKRSPR